MQSQYREYYSPCQISSFSPHFCHQHCEDRHRWAVNQNLHIKCLFLNASPEPDLRYYS